MRILIATVQVPYLSGGAEALAHGLEAGIAACGHSVETVTLPFRFFPPAEVERSMRVWESEDFTRLNMYEPDRVITLKFPAYGLRHPAKALWLLHQHRAAYELHDPATATAEEAALAKAIAAFDQRHLSAIAGRFTISRRVSERLMRSSGLASRALYHPPPAASDYRCAAGQPYVLFPSRFEHAKRQDLVLRAAREMRAPGFVVFAGEGGQIGAARKLAEELGVGDRVRFMGAISREELIALYANATAVCFPPLDEDYGYVTLEAMLSSKPLVTCTDSGGPLEFVVDGETGHVVAPEPEALAHALDTLLSQPARAVRLGRAGRARYDELIPDWACVVETLLVSSGEASAS
jgi:glycosyltransferase involved in cell wall biosynthesis